MAKIEYVHDVGRTRNRGCKYPFEQLRAVGDFFDAPAESKRAIQTAASLQSGRTGKRFTAFAISSGDVRVMLVDIDDGAR